MAAFGLYPSAAMLPAQRIQAGTVLALDTPRDAAGVFSFGRSFWLPLPAGLAQAQTLRLVDSALAVRFEPRRFEVATGQRDWFPAFSRIDADTVRIEFTWPAEVVRVTSPASGVARKVSLFRADGDAVADKPAMQGTTGRDLAEPWVGSPLVARLGLPALRFTGETTFERADEFTGGAAIAVPIKTPQRKAATPARALAKGGAAPSVGIGPDSDFLAVNAKTAVLSNLVPSLTLSGRPTSPRLKLYAESAAGATLLWQSMLPGEQAGVTLPASPVADEWAPAVEQLRKQVADAEKPPGANPTQAPLRLRLDVESDAPCTATLAQLALSVETETELLDAPRRLAFSGASAEAQPLPLSLPSTLPAGSGTLRLTGRVAADNDGAADAGATAADGRNGALLDDGVVAVQAIDWSAPLSLAGVAVMWQPLSDRVDLRLRLLADGSGGPGARVLAQAAASVDTTRPGAVALRWPAVDLQAQRAWVEVAVSAGAGVWLFASAGGPGWIEARNAAGARQPLPAPLAAVPIAAQAVSSPTRAISVRLGDQSLADSLPQGPFEITVATVLPAPPAAGAIVFTGAVRGSVDVESARWAVRSSG